MRRRICAGIVTTAAALALTGCGSGDQDGSPTVTAGTSGAQGTLSRSLWRFGHCALKCPAFPQ